MSTACSLDLACYRNDGHAGDHAYTTPDIKPRPSEQAALRAARDSAGLDLPDIGIYPAASPTGPRTPWQDGWNAAVIAMEDALEARLSGPKHDAHRMLPLRAALSEPKP